MRYSTLLRSSAALLVMACASSTSEAPLTVAAPGTPTISTDKTVYTRADLDITAGGAGVHATLVASPDKPYYSRLGDAFNGALDQNPLYIAEGGDGVLERQSGDSWVKVQGGILVEGIREVMIAPAKSYTVLAHTSPPIQTGTYRVAITLRESQGGAAAVKIASPSFEVR